MRWKVCCKSLRLYSLLQVIYLLKANIDFSNSGELAIPDPPDVEPSFPALLPSTMWPIDSQMEAYLNANSFDDMEPFGGTMQDNLNLLLPSRRGMGSDGADTLSNDSWLFKMTFNGGTTSGDQLNVTFPEFPNPIPTAVSTETIQSNFQINAEDLLERCRILPGAIIVTY
jgi:hypothetical protein